MTNLARSKPSKFLGVELKTGVPILSYIVKKNEVFKRKFKHQPSCLKQYLELASSILVQTNS